MSSYIGTIQEIVQDHKNYKEQTLKMAKSDIIRTYRGSALGWSWALVKPVITIFIYWFAMSIGLRAGRNIGSDYPYFLWLISGLVPWFYMSDMLNRGTDCMRKYRYLITKMHYPVSTIPTFVSVSNMLVDLILMVVVCILQVAFGYYPTLYWLQVPVLLFLSFLLFTFWALFAGPVSALSQDFSQLVKSLVFALFWGSGILFNVETIDNKIIRTILEINPITYLVTSIRHSFMGDRWIWQEPKALAVFLVELLIMGALGVWSYKKLRKEIPDVL